MSYYEWESEWWTEALKALAPAERDALATPLPGEERIEHAVRIARQSRRADPRRWMLVYLGPAARDGNRAAVEAGIEALSDPSKHVRYEACRLVAIAQDRAALPVL